MTREEYLDILQNNLHGIPPQEAENIMEYYREYFDDAGVENAEKVMQELGAPEQLAKRAAADAAAENGFAGAAGSGQIRALEVITDRQPQRKSIRRQALHWR